jgi:phospholipid transport system substrate-binding protein|uniref:ABC transporter substrate-binding protein n=1 Tax=Desulfobacca acetoxidans TaxID=60893 RepID=A0A7C3SJ76_9BACT
MRKFGLGFLFLAMWMLGGLPALAGTPTSYVKGILDEVIAIQNNPALSETTRKEAIRNIIRKNFDFDHMSRDSLGLTYNRLSASQRQEFQEIFSALFQDSYTRLVLNFLKKETVEYKKEQIEGDKARLDTTLIRTNERIPVEYLMHKQGPGWILYDVIVDGVSILDNYRRQFAQTIATKSFDYLMDRMRTQYRAIK